MFCTTQKGKWSHPRKEGNRSCNRHQHVTRCALVFAFSLLPAPAASSRGGCLPVSSTFGAQRETWHELCQSLGASLCHLALPQEHQWLNGQINWERCSQFDSHGLLSQSNLQEGKYMMWLSEATASIPVFILTQSAGQVIQPSPILSNRFFPAGIQVSLNGRDYHFDCTVFWLHFPKLTFGIWGEFKRSNNGSRQHSFLQQSTRVLPLEPACIHIHCNHLSYLQYSLNYIYACKLNSFKEYFWALNSIIYSVFLRMVQLTLPWAISVYQ